MRTRPRLEFHDKLASALESFGADFFTWILPELEEGEELSFHELCSNHVFFQPPPDMFLEYPCIIYSIDRVNTYHANNHPYIHMNRYLVTVISDDPDFPVCDAIAKYPTCEFNRYYSKDGLHHKVYTIYY